MEDKEEARTAGCQLRAAENLVYFWTALKTTPKTLISVQISFENCKTVLAVTDTVRCDDDLRDVINIF